jgi:hypothetical protein
MHYLVMIEATIKPLKDNHDEAIYVYVDSTGIL